MSRLIDIDPDTCQDPQPEAQVYWYSVFEELPNISTIRKVSQNTNINMNEIKASTVDSDTNVKLI